jgi:hypothetical protein
MVIFHSYVSLPEGIYQSRENLSPRPCPSPQGHGTHGTHGMAGMARGAWRLVLRFCAMWSLINTISGNQQIIAFIYGYVWLYIHMYGYEWICYKFISQY